ncbi:MAG: HAD family hydrolase [Candidatus Auribacterota bacterium]|jgi:2-hydroxy-3-keto-5-methylthiopentenyl-1-phosphate phosphatase|nr:HAD family hydrolase [Candidatus Auribacterota bacterium]
MGKKHTTLAIAYDFDGTLAKGNIQENSFIPDLRMKKSDFWKEVKKLTKEHEMDEILAYMFLLINKARQGEIKFDRESLKAHGKDVSYFDGVEDYFGRINKYAHQKQIKLEHYIISSGTKEMIEGTTIAKHFKTIYASSFKYDQHNVPEWPAIALNYTTKTQFLFRINKGINNAWDNSKINAYVPKEERPIPFERMIYIGDGLTDVPAMKLVKDQGGTSIGVYAPKSRKKSAVEKLLDEQRVSYVAPANYSDGSELDQIIKAVIDQTSSIASVQKYADITKKKEGAK